MSGVENYQSLLHQRLDYRNGKPDSALAALAWEIRYASGVVDVVLVEDDPSMTALVTTVLRADNIRLIAAETCGIAIPTLRRSRPRLLLVDLGLPDGDGLDIARRVREWQDFPHIPIVALTSSPEKAGAAWKAGMDGIIAKPFEIKSFRKMVASWLRTN
jgi:DNA-binding response OmpR family regulator